MAVQTQIQVRRGTASSWTSTNPTLAAGEWGLETDTGKYKVGNGSSVWTSLAYSSVLPSTLTAKGDILAASAASTPAALAVGNNGETIVADSSTSTGLRYQGNYAAGKNKFLNGDFSIWQRGTSTTLSAGFAYTADRYYAGGNGTVSQQTFTAGTAPVAGYEGKYFARWNLTSNSQNYEFMQRIESARTFAGQTATFSFWAKLNSGTASFNVVAYQSFGTGGSPSSLVNVIPSTAISLTSSWQRFTYTVAVPSVAGKTFGTNNDDYLYMSIQSTSTNTGAFDTWGWQAEAGNTATAFATATGTIQGELAACQRYFQTIQGNATASTAGVSFAYASSTTNGVAYFYPRASFRVVPSVAQSSLYLSDIIANNYTVTGLSVNSSASTVDMIRLDAAVASGLTAKNWYSLQGNATTSYVQLSAEL